MRLARFIIAGVFLIGLFGVVGTPPTLAATVKDSFFQADNAYRSLLKSPTRQKYREHWFNVIRRFDQVFRMDPDGQWAAASLYRMGELYKGMYRYSYKKGDMQEARDIFERIVRRFPRSAYRHKALAELKAMGETKSVVSPSPPAAGSPARTSSADQRAYKAAEKCAQGLTVNKRREKHRDVWIECIEQYENIASDAAGQSIAAAALFKAGGLYLDLYSYSRSPKDKEKGDAYLERVKAEYPDSRYRPMAEARLGERSRVPDASPPPQPDPVAALINEQSSGGRGRQDGMSPEASSIAGMKRVTGLRFWSNPSYTRVVIDADNKTPYFHHLLKKDPDLKKPQRLYVDISNTRMGKDIPKLIDINDNLLIATRAGQYAPDTVRVVVDIKSFRTYKIFSLMNPFRIIIDVWGEDSSTVASRSGPAVVLPKNGKMPPGALAKQLALGVRRIVVDPGHGGKDPGALGYLKGVREKDITLSISKKVSKKLQEQLGYEVLMTRSRDVYLTLEERTAFANTKNADLFISIHTNAHRNRDAYGMETYFLNLATDDDAIRVAAMENATSAKNISDLQTILSDLMQNAKINESSRLAASVQTAMYGKLKGKYKSVKNLGVKQAPFYVLLGAQMPAILVETSFISNPRECKRLVDPRYQDHLADAIVAGVQRYIREMQPSASFRPPPRDHS
ncbi:MAG: N-acetylmuramoyl-L-alanine amidase [Desulfobacterales bacterium]|jgi:N-acetylmuramoyl-L-alanine amidase